MQRGSRGAKATEACHALPRSLRRCKASSTLSHHLFTLNHHTARCAARLITLPLSDDTCCGYRGHAAAYRPRLRARCGGSACGSACGCSALAARAHTLRGTGVRPSAGARAWRACRWHCCSTRLARRPRTSSARYALPRRRAAVGAVRAVGVGCAQPAPYPLAAPAWPRGRRPRQRLGCRAGCADPLRACTRVRRRAWTRTKSSPSRRPRWTAWCAPPRARSLSAAAAALRQPQLLARVSAGALPRPDRAPRTGPAWERRSSPARQLTRARWRPRDPSR